MSSYHQNTLNKVIERCVEIALIRDDVGRSRRGWEIAADIRREFGLIEHIAKAIYEVDPIQNNDGPISWDNITKFQKELRYKEAQAAMSTIEQKGGDAPFLTTTVSQVHSVCNEAPGKLPPGANLNTATIEVCAQVAEGPFYKERYRGTENGNWAADGSSDYGRGRLAAAKAIRALLPQPKEGE